MRQGRQYSKSQLLQSIKNYYVQQQHMLAAVAAAGMEFKVVDGKLKLHSSEVEAAAQAMADFGQEVEVAAPCVE